MLPALEGGGWCELKMALISLLLRPEHGHLQDAERYTIDTGRNWGPISSIYL